MKSIADQLPPEIARQIHPDRRKNEAAYWAARDQLLDEYRGQWIGFADGRVVASGTSPVTVFQAAEATGLHPFFICVGREDEPCRIRRATFPYTPVILVKPCRRSASSSGRPRACLGSSWIGSFLIRRRMRASCPGQTVSSFN
jgi:hypothetical protein